MKKIELIIASITVLTLLLFAVCKPNLSNPDNQFQNTISDSPPFYTVTNVIDKDLVGKYVAENDPEMYFEIKENGEVEISLTNLEGYIKLNSDDVLLTAYYYNPAQVKRCILTFHILKGELHFPIGSGMAINFESEYDNYYKAFTPLVNEDYELFVRFIKEQ